MMQNKIIGLSDVWKQLVNYFHRQQIPHAIFLYGENHIGKHFLAKRFARLLNCVKPHESGEPCEECMSCWMTKKDRHPDIHEIFPMGQTVEIDNIRQLKHLASQFPAMKKYNVFIIDGLEQMQTAAANSLLKLLEEPGKHVQFLLIGKSREKVIKTILSRVSELYCPSPSKIEIQNFLSSVNGLSDEVKEQMQYLFERRIGQMLSYLENSENYTVQHFANLSHAMANYERAFEQFEQSIFSYISSHEYFPSAFEIYTILEKSQVMFLSKGRFQFIQAIFLLENKPKRSTLHFLSDFVERIFSQKRDFVFDEIMGLLESKSREFKERKKDIDELKEAVKKLVRQRFMVECREILIQSQLFCHEGIRELHLKAATKGAISHLSSLCLKKYGLKGLYSLYTDFEGAIQNIHKNGYLPLQLTFTFLKFAY
ncbi:hypothetical protein ACFL35_03285 [Candidatus Riflebacteria bacterium]